MLTKDHAICIRAVDYSETSQILSFFTRKNGKISAIAKGAKRPKSNFDGPIEIFTSGNIVFADSKKQKLATLTEFQQQSTFSALAKDLFALHCASFAAELTELMTDDYDPHPQLFDQLLELFKNLSNTKNKTEVLTLLILFQLALLKQVGLQPVLNACTNCKSNFNTDWPQTYFCHSANGLICRDCEPSFEDKMKLSKNVANSLANLKLLASANQTTLSEIEKLLIHHFTETLNRPPRMAKYILKT